MSRATGKLDALNAVLSVAEGLDTMVSVQRAIDSAMTLTRAQYGAVGIYGPSGKLSEFIYRGVSEGTREEIGSLPQGRGVLGLLARSSGPLRLSDVDDHPAASGYPPHHPHMRSFLGVPITVDGEPFGSIYLCNKEGGNFTARDEAFVASLAEAVTVAVRNNRSYERTRQRERWQRAATAIDYAVLSGSEPVEVLGTIAAEARRLSGADVALVALPDDDHSLVLEIVDVRNVRAPGDARWSVDRSRRHTDDAHLTAAGSWLGMTCDRECLLHASFASGQTMLAPGLQGAPSDAVMAEAFATAVAIPMRTPDRSLGVLGLLWDHEVPQLTGPALEVAESFAAQAAVTLMLAESRREYENLLVFRDRDRIARDMHDLVVQRVFATGMSLAGALRSEGVPEPLRSRIERAIADLDETLTEIRRTIFDLHTTPTPPPSTKVRIQRELSAAGVLLGFAPQAQMTGAVDAVPALVAEHLLAALREALSNASRHAAATSVRVDITVDAEEASLMVTDDGVGPPSTLTRHSGIKNLAARAEALGGSSGLYPAPGGRGSQLRWRVPLA